MVGIRLEIEPTMSHKKVTSDADISPSDLYILSKMVKIWSSFWKAVRTIFLNMFLFKHGFQHHYYFFKLFNYNEYY